MRTRPSNVLAFAFVLLAFASILFAACARPGSSPVASTSGGATPTQASSSSGGGSSGTATPTQASSGSATPTQASSSGGAGSAGATVHMNDSNFVESSVTLSKGSSLTLVDDAAVVHIINNGTWDNGTPKPTKEAGAPTVNETFQGKDSKTVGPFNTAGTFQLYCTVHPGMNLTVTVK